jgi:PAS domain S-box-containing protein
LKAVAAYVGVLGFMALFSLMAAYDLVPPFFIQEIGPTALRQVVLGTAVFLYILSSIFFMLEYLKWKFDFFYWYSLSLVLLATGLFAFFVQSAVGSPLGWVGRSANYFGGIFSLIAVLRAVRVARSKSLPLEESIAIFFSDAESSYKSLVEVASDAIISFDQEDRIIGWNASAANMFGHTKGEAVGSSFFELVIPETYVGVLKKDIELVIARSNTSPLASPLEIKGKRSDGSPFPVEVSVSVREMPTGRVSTCIVRDITDRKQTEDRIRRLNETLELRVAQRTAELETSYQTIQEEVDLHKRTAENLRQVSQRLQFHMGNTPLAVIEWDHNYRVTAWTKSAQRIFGWTSDEVIGKRIDELGIVYKEDWNKVQEVMTTMDNETLSSNISHNRNYRKDGSVIFCEWYNSSLSDESGDLRSVLSLVLDVTERQRSEESLRQSEELFRDVFKYAPVGMVLTATDGKLHKVNSSFSSMLGYTEKDLLGADYRAITHPDDLEVSNAQVISILSGEKESAYFEKRYVHKNGNILWTLVSTFLLRDSDGNAKHFVTLVQDITDRKRAEEAIRESEERYRSLFENMLEGFAYCKMFFEDGKPQDFIYLDVNDAFERLTGLKNVVGKKVSEVIPGIRESHPELLEIYGRVALTGNPEKAEIYLDSLGIWFTLSVYSSEREYFVSVFDNITEGKLSEQALRESEESSRLLIEQAPIGIGIMQEGVLTNVNPQFLKVFGYDSMHEVLGLPVEEFYSPEDRSLITQRGKDRLSGKPLPTHYEVKGLKKNGESFDLAVWPTVVDYDGKPAILTFCADTTETKSLRSQLLQAQKMEAVGNLAGGVAHDFNNLLQVALGYSEILLVGKNPDHPDYDKLHTINATAKRGADLVQRLMVFSRKGDTKPRSLNLNHEVTQLKKLLERTIPKMIAIELSLESWLPVINADPVQVEQILLNLAVNARDAMPQEGGKLTIETRKVMLDEEYCRMHLEAKQGQYVMISVSDTGHGMSQETVQHIFEPFFTTKGEGKGTGLGLAMVYGIMKHHEGFINCKSEPNKGTTFRIYFPVVPMELEEDLEQESAVPQGGSETILLVDDEESLCDIGSQILTRAGYTVLTATNGRDAIDLYRNQRGDISLVILDLIMPEMGGKECFQELAKIDSKVKVILSSGFLSNRTSEETRVFGFRGLVEKPYNMRELLGMVRDVLDAN